MQLDDVIVRNRGFWLDGVYSYNISISWLLLFLPINQQTLKVGYVQNGEKFR